MSEFALPEDFTGRYGPWAVIAGGSEGVGESFARMLAAAGVNLVLLARRQAPLEALKNSILSQAEVEIRIASVDLTDHEVVAGVAAITDDLDVGLFIYNAGSVVAYDRFPDWSSENLNFMLALNCYAPTHLAHCFARGMCERGRGGMIFLSSMAAMAGSAWASIYPATKAFDQMLAEGLWADLKPSGVDVMCLTLGATRTPSHDHVDFDAFGGGMDCDQAAWEGLSHLGNGPLWVAGESNRERLPEDYLESRPEVIDMMSWGTAIINGLDHVPVSDATKKLA